MDIPETRYAKTADGVHIAYQVVGSGPVDLVFVWGWFSDLEYGWKEPRLRRFYERLGASARLILFDKRGTGLSDRVPDHRFRKTHDIGELAVASLTYVPQLEGLLRWAAPLTEYAWRFRYPGEIFEPAVNEVRDATSIAADVMAAVVSSVEPSVG